MYLGNLLRGTIELIGNVYLIGKFMIKKGVSYAG